jgi:hypothetical protein
MLQKLDTEHLNRLALAEALANMSTGDFDMRDTSRCICGHALRMFGEHAPQVFFCAVGEPAPCRCGPAGAFH